MPLNCPVAPYTAADGPGTPPTTSRATTGKLGVPVGLRVTHPKHHMFIIYIDYDAVYLAGYRHHDGRVFQSIGRTRHEAIGKILCSLDPTGELLAGARRYHNHR